MEVEGRKTAQQDRDRLNSDPLEMSRNCSIDDSLFAEKLAGDTSC